LVSLSLTEYQQIECHWNREQWIYEGTKLRRPNFGLGERCENSRILREFAKT